MNHTPFIKGLLITSVIAFVVSYAFSLMPEETAFQNVIFGSLAFFAFFTVFQYVVGLRVTNHPNKGLYIGMVQLLSGLKIAVTIFFIVIFMELAKPETTWFVLPFLLNYVIFTVFETATLMRVGNEKPKPKK